MPQFDWLKKLANCYGRPFARLGIRQKKRNLANPSQFNVIRIGKSWRIPKDLANPDFLAKAYSVECLVLTIKNRGLANPYILANAYSGELLRALRQIIEFVLISVNNLIILLCQNCNFSVLNLLKKFFSKTIGSV